jgi:hypothetical protein
VPKTINENDSTTLSGTFTDPGVRDSHTVVISWGDGSPDTTLTLAAGVLSFGAAHRYLDDNPTGTASDLYTINVSVTDKDAGGASGSTTVAVNNVAPVVGPITGAPVDPQPVGYTATITAAFTDQGTKDTHTATIYWDYNPDTPALTGPTTACTPTSATCKITEPTATTPGSFTASYEYAAAGVYVVRVTVADDDGGAGETFYRYVVVYDPNGGFVTGGGWIDSPPGAYAPNPAVGGKASFGFVSKYKQGSNVPTGETEFQLQLAGFNFHSTAYSSGSLVTSGPMAQYRGTGTVNGVGGYSFVLTARDGQAARGGGTDGFRMKIWNTTTGVIVYDNVKAANDDLTSANTQTLGGGSILIHGAEHRRP